MQLSIIFIYQFQQNFVIIILYINRKINRVKRLMKNISLLGTSSLFSSSEMQQINFFTSFVLAVFFLKSKANFTLLTPSQAKAVAFILANPLKSWQIQPMPPSTFSLILFYDPNK